MATARLKPVLFLAFASEIAGATLERLPEEARRLRTTLRKAEDAGWCDTVFRQDVTFNDILDVFQDPHYHGRIALFHYAGHADAYSLLLSDAQGRGRAIHAKGFAAFLAEQPGLDVVVLNGCSTQPQVDDLLAAGVRAVIATGAEIPDEWALAFGERFYAGLAGGSGLAAAFRAAEGALEAELGEQEWPWGLFPAPESGAVAGWTLPGTLIPQRDYLWVNVPLPPKTEPVGRDELLATWMDRLTTSRTQTLAIHGLAGVGKTTLALLLAHDARLRKRCVDGVLWASLGRNGSVTAVQARWADRDALNVDLNDLVDAKERQERLSSVVGDRRLLVVLDDVWDSKTARALHFSGPGVVHVLTTRNEEIAAEFGGSVEAPELDAETAWQLLYTLAKDTCDTDPASARALCDSVSGLPLMVELLGGYLAAPLRTKFASQRTKRLKAASNPSERLALASRRLGDAVGELQTLETVIRLSVDDLEQTVPEAVPIFWALGAFAPKPATFDVAAVRAVVRADEDMLSLLAARHLVEIGDDELIRVHQVVHDVMAKETPAEVVERQREYYLDLVDEDREDWQCIESIYDQLRYAWQRMFTRGEHSRILSHLERVLRMYQMRRGLWQDRIDLSKGALRAAEARSSLGDQASSLTSIAMAHAVMGKHAEALGYQEQALPIYRNIGDIAGEGNALNGIGSAYLALGNKELARTYFELALKLKRQAKDAGGEAKILDNLGVLYLTQGMSDRALDYLFQTLPLLRRLDDRSGLASALHNIGHVYLVQGNVQQALDYSKQAQKLRIELGDLAGQATSLNDIGVGYFRNGEYSLALASFEEALALHIQLGVQTGESLARFHITMAQQALDALQNTNTEL